MKFRYFRSIFVSVVVLQALKDLPNWKSQQTHIFTINILRDTKGTSAGKCESLLPEFVLMIFVECTMGRLV